MNLELNGMEGLWVSVALKRYARTQGGSWLFDADRRALDRLIARLDRARRKEAPAYDDTAALPSAATAPLGRTPK